MQMNFIEIGKEECLSVDADKIAELVISGDNAISCIHRSFSNSDETRPNDVIERYFLDSSMIIDHICGTFFSNNPEIRNIRLELVWSYGKTTIKYFKRCQ
jgi:hypothetical protein